MHVNNLLQFIESCSEDGDKSDTRRKQKSAPGMPKLTETPPKPRGIALTENPPVIKCESPRHLTASQRTYSAPGMTNLNPVPTSPVFFGSANDPPPALPTKLRSNPHHNSAFTTPPRTGRKTESTVPVNNSKSTEFSWFYERYRAYYQYYMHNMTGAGSGQPTNLMSVTSLPSSMVQIQPMAASASCVWAAVPNVPGAPSHPGLNISQFSRASPSSSYVPVQTSNTGNFQIGIPTAFQDCFHSEQQQNMPHQISSNVDQNSTNPTENGALDYTLTTLSKLQTSSRRGWFLGQRANRLIYISWLWFRPKLPEAVISRAIIQFLEKSSRNSCTRTY